MSESSPNDPKQADSNYREVKFAHSPGFPEVLNKLGISLAVSTYQAGKLGIFGEHQGELTLSFHSCDQAMGIAVHPQQLVLGSRTQIWQMRSNPDLARNIEPRGQFDGCYLTRQAFATGHIHGHELAFSGDTLWAVNTLFSCLCTLDEDFSFVPRWRPPFIKSLEGKDKCHLNGMAMENGQPRYVTAMAETDEPAGWRPTKATTGCIIDVPSNETVATGFSMPHSPRLYNDKLWALDSGKGLLVTVDPANGQVTTVADFPGYTRGLAFVGPIAFVGLSRIRETSVFSDIPIAEKRDELCCGVAAIDLRTGKHLGGLRFHSGVEEVFDVQILPFRQVKVVGPQPDRDEQPDIWVVPPEQREIPKDRPGWPAKGSS